MQLKKISIKRFKILESIEIEVSGLDVLVGVNNSGKTAIQQALLWSDYIINRCIWVDRGKIKFKNATDYGFTLIPYDLPPDLWTNRKFKKGHNWSPIEFRLVISDSQDKNLNIEILINNYYGNFHYGVKMYHDRGFKVDEFHEYVKNPVLYIPSATGIVEKEEFHTVGVRSSYLTSGLGGQTIRSSLYDFHKEEQEKSVSNWKLLENQLKELFKTSGIDISFEIEKDAYVRAIYTEGSNKFEFISAGSGFHQFISIFSRIMIENPRLILLDEPDAHLNTMLIKGLIDSLRHWKQDSNCQIVIATHSRDIINACDGNEINILDQGKLLTVSEDIMQDAYNILGISKESTVQITEVRKAFIYEGKSDEKLLFGLAKLLYEDFDSKIKGVFTIPIGGKEEFQPSVNFFNSLSNKIGKEIKLFFVRDRDFMSNDIYDKKLQTYRENVQSSYILKFYEIENYLIIYRPLAEALGKCNIKYTEDTHREIIDSFIQENEVAWESSFENSYAYDHKESPSDPKTRTNAKNEFRTQRQQEPMKVIKGKEYISYLSNKINEKYGENIHIKSEILKYMTVDDIDSEIKEIVDALLKFAEE